MTTLGETTVLALANRGDRRVEGQWPWLADPHGAGAGEVDAEGPRECRLTTASSARVNHEVPSLGVSARGADAER